MEIFQYLYSKFFQKPNSSLKRLAVAKFEQGSIGKSKKEKQSVEEADFNISSDDEPFDVMFA